MPAPKSMFALMLDQIRRVPHGKVASYGDIAYAAGFPGAARQAAWALHGSHGVPWHRIVGADGKILLPGEAGFEQRMRLQSEGVQFFGLRVNMKVHRHSFFAKQSGTRDSRGKVSRKASKKSSPLASVRPDRTKKKRAGKRRAS